MKNIILGLISEIEFIKNWSEKAAVFVENMKVLFDDNKTLSDKQIKYLQKLYNNFVLKQNKCPKYDGYRVVPKYKYGRNFEVNSHWDYPEDDSIW